MKKILLFCLTLLISLISYSKEYQITYVTMDNQYEEKEAIISVIPDNGTFKITIKTNNDKILLSSDGYTMSDHIKLLKDEKVNSGCIYSYEGKLRGNIFLNNNIIIMIKEI